MLWMDRVPSLRYQPAKTTVSTTAKKRVEAMYGTRNSTCRTSAAIVPKIATIVTASQYTHGT